ncbi:hypothetical protein LJC57_04065 [Parabacteroides sp. OttesenSCG-928-G07]|nr:hypothetical protein [Parabacteroides sp. OttesenSCG-928-G07]
MIAGGYNNADALDVDLSFSFFFSDYWGITAGITGISKFKGEKTYTGITDNNERWNIRGEDAEVGQLLFRAALRLRSPEFPLPLVKNWMLSANIEPGIYVVAIPDERISVPFYAEEDINMINPTHRKHIDNEGGQSAAWHMKNYIEIRVDNMLFSVGYVLSNFDVYSSRRHIKIEEYSLNQLLPDKKLSFTTFAMIGYRF